ncbi:MAG: Eco57I restriction-modification methylase domain-containing protein [Capnocytophaga felis]|nr:Eco57I restriction-modification methylase domain-containing protein [Capnocytophaga felis]
MKQKSKILGQVYTPKWIVNEILNEIGYLGQSVLDKYILEPSCGDGAFLCEIVRRYIFEAQKAKIPSNQIVENLQTYIYGVEIDKQEHIKCIENLNKLVFELLPENHHVQWNVFDTDTLLWYKDYQKFFDFVVGNPPYIRIHNLDEKTRTFLKENFSFSVGTIDIYLSFFELGFNVLKSNGKLGYITPNSFLRNTSYKKFREFLKAQKKLTTLIDFKSNKVFQGFSTYTAISIFDTSNQKEYFEYKELKNDKIISVNTINFKELEDKKWSFSNKMDSEFIATLFNDRTAALRDFFDIQYGFATLRDKIFIGKSLEKDEKHYLFNGVEIEKSILRKIVKGSRYKGNVEEIEWVLFPYEKVQNRFVVISEEKLQKHYPKAYEYLLSHKEELQKRDMDKGALWYEFGRSQGVQTIHKEKIVVNTLVNGKVIFHKLPKDVFVYSGIFITQKNELSQWEIMEDVLGSQEFYKYIRIMGKDFSGGYKSISTKQIKEYKINYKNPNTLF